MRNRLVVKNAIANLVRGSTIAMSTVLLPLFLTRFLPSDEYNLWVVVMQVASYVMLLDLGVQTAVVRFVAHGESVASSGSADRTGAVVRIAVVWLAAMAVVGVLVAGIIAVFLPSLFSRIPHEYLKEGRVALLVLAGSVAFSLPTSVFAAWFVGKQRNVVPAVAAVVPRVIAIAFAIFTARAGHGLVALALVVGGGNVLASVAMFVLFRRAGGRFGRRVARPPGLGRELFSFSWVLTVFTLAMLVIQGIDVVVVGRFDYSRVGAYGFAASVVVLIGGLLQGIFAVLVAPAASLTAAGDAEGLGRLVIDATRFGTLLLGAGGLTLFCLAEVVCRSLPSAYGRDAATLLRFLIVAQAIRLSAVPFANVLVGSGDHRFAVVGAIGEATANLVASLALGAAFGARGVALGTLVGSCVGIGANLAVTMPRTVSFRVDRPKYVWEGLMRPLFALSPLALAAVASVMLDGGAMWIAFAFGLLGAVAGTASIGLAPAERAALGRSARSLRSRMR